MVHDRQTDGCSVGRERRKGGRDKMSIERKKIQGFPPYLRYFLAMLTYERKSTYLFAVSVCFSLPPDRWQCLETFWFVTSAGRGYSFYLEVRDQRCCKAPCSAQESSPQGRISQPQTSLLGGETLHWTESFNRPWLDLPH